MCKFNLKSGNTRIDHCMKNLIRVLKDYGMKTRGCCCGHGKYPMTIIAWDKNLIRNVEIMSMKIIPRKKKFYKRDKEGVYYIPEVINKR